MNRRIRKKQENRRKIQEYDRLLEENSRLKKDLQQEYIHSQYLRNQIVSVGYEQVVSYSDLELLNEPIIEAPISTLIEVDGRKIGVPSKHYSKLEYEWVAQMDRLVNDFGRYLGRYLIEHKLVTMYREDTSFDPSYGPMAVRFKFRVDLKKPDERSVMKW